MDCSSPAFQELLPVTARAMALAVDYAHGHVISAHRHTHAQLLYAIEGVMTIEAQGGRIWAENAAGGGLLVSVLMEPARQEDL